MLTLSLIQRTLGWALVRSDGETAFRAYGPNARQRCLAWAARLGSVGR